MPSSTSSSDSPARPGFVRQTASDRPGVAQPVPERDIPLQPWGRIFAAVAVLFVLALGAWEWRMRSLELLPGDLGDDSSTWAEQRRRIDAEPGATAIVGDSRILFDTDLDRFEALTGVRPVQLALQGTNGRPFLQDLADDADFTGLAIVGIAEVSYFRDAAGLKGDVLKRYRHESPSDRSSYLLHRALSRVFGFIDEEYRLSKLVRRLDPGLRAGARGPDGEPWKMITATDGRQAWLWQRIEHDARLAAHAMSVWNNWGRQPPVADDVIARTQALTREAVAKIRARGGEVVFIRPPSAPALRVIEDQRLPRARGWDALLAAAGVSGIHADDDAAMQGLVLPENSHLSRRCATVFTDAYVRRLAALGGRIALRAGAPAPLSATDCTAR
jgi:hypothetical protein